MLIQPADGSPGIFVDRLKVTACVPNLAEYDPPGSYVVVTDGDAFVIVSKEHGERLLAELAAK